MSTSFLFSRIWSRVVAIALAIGLVLAVPALLFAHARLVRSTPASGSALVTLPTRIALWFSERPELKLTTIKLTDSTGAAVPLGVLTAGDSNSVSAAIVGTLQPGRYTVSWKAVADDGHPSSGSFPFTIAAAAAAAMPVTIDTARISITPADSAIVHTTIANSLIVESGGTTFSTTMRWVELVALLSVIGLVIFRLAVLPAASWSSELVSGASDRAMRLGRALLIVFLVATLTRGLAQADLLPAFVGSRFDALRALVENTRWGTCWATGIVGALIVLLGLVVAGRSIVGWVLAAIGVIIVAVSESLTGHSGSVQHAAAAIAADVAHILGAGGWLGGLVALLLCGLPMLRATGTVARANEAGGRLLRAYHGTATECVTVVIASAIIAAWVRFPTLNALWTTEYGLALLRKTIFVLIVLAFGAYHWRRVVLRDFTDSARRAFKRTAFLELVFAAVVVALTAVLVAKPLP